MPQRLLNLSLYALVQLAKLALTARSQRRSNGYGYFMLGPENENVASINALLSREDRPNVTGRSFAVGGGGGMQRGRWRIGGEGEGGGEAVNLGGKRTAYGSGGGGPTLSYEVVRSGGLRIYPIIGLGGAGGGLMSSDVSAPKTGTALGGGGAMLVAGVGIEITLGKFGDRGRLVAGVRLGYRVKTFNGWQRTALQDGQPVEVGAANIEAAHSAGTFWRFIVGMRSS